MTDNEAKNSEQKNQSSEQKDKEEVIYTSQSSESSPSSVNTSEIPEEYLTDEYLYPSESSSEASIPNKKKTFVFTLVVIVFLLVIGIVFFIFQFSKGKTAPEAGGKINLTYWALWDNKLPMEQIIADYEKENPNISINYIVMDAKDSYRERIIARTEKGTGPDIFRFHNTWVSSMKNILAPAPVTVFDVESFRKTYYPVIANDLIVDNNIVGVPLHIDGIVLITNKRLLNSAGVDTTPTDWESLVDISRTLTVKGSKGTIEFGGIAMGTAENIDHFSDIIGLMFLQNSVDFKNLSGDENALTVLETYTSFAIPPTDTWNETLDNSITAFANEKVGMIFAPYWELEIIKRLNPDIDIVVYPVPQIQGGIKKAIASYWVEGVSKGSKNQEEAWKFLAYLSKKETLIKLQELEMKNGRIFPPRPYPRIDMADLIIQDKFMGPVIQQAPYYDSIPFIGRTFDNGINDKIIVYLTDAVNSILFGGSPQQALSTFASGFSQITEQYNYGK